LAGLAGDIPAGAVLVNTYSKVGYRAGLASSVSLPLLLSYALCAIGIW